MRARLTKQPVQPATAPEPPRNGLNVVRLARMPKASDLIATQVRRMILDGTLSDGDLLPPETQLSAEFGVARPTLREALRVLETEGLIRVARGSRRGACVNTPKVETSARYAAYSLRAAGATLAETYSAQLAIEPYAVKMLATGHDPDVIAELEDRLAKLEALDPERDPAGRSVALARFHLALVKLTGNRTLAVLAETLTRIIESHQARHRPPVADFTQQIPEREFRALGPRSIRKLIDLIREARAEEAETHWRKHLENASRFWLAGLDPDAVIDFGD
jgi:GntR family transcriptional repressor for pyruvate dehydrogenase complex